MSRTSLLARRASSLASQLSKAVQVASPNMILGVRLPRHNALDVPSLASPNNKHTGNLCVHACPQTVFVLCWLYITSDSPSQTERRPKEQRCLPYGTPECKFVARGRNAGV